MGFLVRKIYKRSSIDSFSEATVLSEMYADAPVTEFKTTKGTLSAWFIEDLNQIENAILAILVTSTKVERMDFIAIDTRILDKYGLSYEKSFAGCVVAVPTLQDIHYDIKEITIEKLMNCSQVYKEVIKQADNSKYIVRYPEGKMLELLKRALSEKILNKELLNDNIKDWIKKRIDLA